MTYILVLFQKAKLEPYFLVGIHSGDFKLLTIYRYDSESDMKKFVHMVLVHDIKC